MQSKQYTIGEFAAINKISTRMLRHYDKIELFKPVTILPNGYRAYSSEQIVVLSKIRQYQSCGFTLSEVGELLHADEEKVMNAVREKQRELRAQDQDADSVYKRLSALLGTPQIAFEYNYVPSFTLHEERLLLVCEAPVSECKIESSFEQLYDMLEAVGASSGGLPILLSEGVGDAVYRTAVEVKRVPSHSGFIFRPLPGGWYLSTLHFGDYGSIGAAYDYLWRYAGEQKYAVTDLFMERYFLDRIHTADSNEYITEISVKITP